MFRSDRDALAQEVDDLRRERAELRAQNEAMRTDLLTRRQVTPALPGTVNVYKQGIDHLTQGERAALAHHDVEAFPPWAVVLLHFVTAGLFPLVHFGKLHDQLPRAERDDPTTIRGIGFSFIPYFNFYWIVFNAARIADRINLQFRLRGLPDQVPRGLVIAAGVVTVIPYAYIFLGYPIFWPIALYYLQRATNALAALPGDGVEAVVAAETARRWAAAPRVRVPRVQDLPGPDDVVEAEAEREADAAAGEVTPSVVERS